MDGQTPLWSEIISSSVVPVVIISACGLLCLAFYNRLSVIVARLRSLQRERLAEYKEIFHLEDKVGHENKKKEAEQYLHFLEGQTAYVLKRARYLRNCIFCMISCICSLVLTSLFIGLSVAYVRFDYAVLVFFILGMFLLLYGLIFAVMEIRISLRPIQMESGFVQKLIKIQLDKE